jgi:starch synthase
MRVAILSSEAVPYAKTGGLADVAGALPKALRQEGVAATLITPLYRQTARKYLNGPVIDDLLVDWRGGKYPVKVFYSQAGDAPAYFIDAPEFFDRDSIYGFREDHLRFAFFCRAAIDLMRRLGEPFDIVHLNDWHSGFAAVELAVRRHVDNFFRPTRTVFSIHNLAYQGVFDPGELWQLGFGQTYSTNAFMLNGTASALKAGLAVSDMLSTVSNRYSFEIRNHEHGAGLDWLLRERANRLIGITNGVDYDVWNPATDPDLPAHFHAGDLTGKQMCKRALLENFSLPVHLDRPLFGVVSRLTSQKGVELIREAAGEIISTGAYFVALGSGDKQYENFFQSLRDYAPQQVGIFKGYNESLAHLIEAGADIFLMPSQFEPCGLNQMYSLRYGTIPIVRAVGGLDDTVENFNLISRTGNGFKFDQYNANSFIEKVYEALFAYADRDLWQKIQSNGMRVDNSWQNAARKYIQMYRMTLN